MKKVTTYKGAVMTWECDSNQHMNVMYYINKFEMGGRNFSHELGLYNIDNNPDIGMVVLEQKINYLKEVFEDDLLKIESSLLEIGNKTFTVLHEMHNVQTKELVCTMKLVLVLFDKIKRKSMPLPEDKRQGMKKWICTASD